MIEKIKNLKIELKHLLTNNPDLRDSDPKLISTVWNKQLQDPNISAVELMLYLASGKLKSTESITRARRLIQEQNPELRGKTYGNRRALAS